MTAAAPSLRRLCELLELEAEAINRLDVETLAAVSEERQRVLAALPSLVPADAPLARSVEGRGARNERAASDALGVLGQKLGEISRGRQAARGYASAPTARYLDHEA